MGVRTHQLLPEGAQYLTGTPAPRIAKVNANSFPITTLLFQKDAGQYAYYKLPVIGYTTGNITFQVVWFSAGASTVDAVTWGVSVSAVTPNLDNVDVTTKAFAAEATASTTHLGSTAKRVHSTTITIENLDQMRATDQLWLRLGRKNDSYVDDVHVVQIVLSYPASAAGIEPGGYYDIHTYATYEACRNSTASQISKGTPVYITGQTGDKITVAPADASDPAKMPAIGLVANNLAAGADGYVHVIGACKGVNTNGLAVNQTLYVAPGGGLTPTKPVNPNLIQNIGKVLSIGNNGEILILGPGRTNDVPALAQGQVFVGNASGVTEQRQLTLADLGGGGAISAVSLALSGFSLTGAQSDPQVSGSATWNTSAAPTLVRFNVTDTASSPGSNLLELRTNNTNRFAVGKTGTVASNAITVSGYSLTGAEATSALDISGTWNTSGTPTAIKLNVTDTASNASSLLMDLQVGGSSKFKVDKDGGIVFVGDSGIKSAGNIRLWSTNGASIIIRNSTNTQSRLSLDSNGGVLTLTNNSNQASSLLSDAVDVLAQRNATNTQALRVYRTFTDASNYEALELAHATYSGGQYSILRTITAGTGADNINLVLSPSGNGAITAHMPDGTGTGGNVRGNNAVDLQTDRLGIADRVASGRASFVVGRGNSASGSYSVGLGYNCLAMGTHTIAQGQSSQAAASFSFSRGIYAISYLSAAYTQAAGRFAITGDAQITTVILRQATTDAIPTELFLDGTSERAVLPNNTRWLATVRVVASTNNATAEWASFQRCCLIGRTTSAATTAIVGEVQTINSDIGPNKGSPPDGWSLNLSADTTNGSLKIEATGVAGKTIRWVAHIDLVEVGFA